MNHVRRWAPLAVFVLVPSALILPILFSGQMLYGHDVVSLFHYQRIAISQAFREGRLPVWDPHVMAGFPLMAAVQGAVFYPPTWFCIFLTAGVFWTLSAWAHLILAGAFAHRWLERGLGLGVWSALAGAFIFMMSGYLAAHLLAGHVNYVWAYPWLAALLWRLERFLSAPTLKRGVLLAVVLALLFLAGVPQYVFFAALIVLGRAIHFVYGDRDGRKDRAIRTGRAAGWLALGLLLAAPQLFPTLELVGQMQRGSAEDRDFITEHPVSPGGIIEILFPPTLVRSDVEFTDPYDLERCGYLGGAAVLLLLAALFGKHRQRYFWAAFATTALLLSLGTHTPLYPGFVWLVPGADLFRGPARYLVVFTLGAAALASLGFEGLWERERRPFRIGALVLALMAALQLTHFAMPFAQPINPRKLALRPDVQRHLAEKLGLEGRVATTGAQDIGKCQAEGIDTVCGYEPMMLRRYAELLNAAEGVPIERSIVIRASVGRHPVVDMMATRAWYFSDVHDYANPMPRAWVVNNGVVIESKQERLKVLARGPWDPRKTVILEEYPGEAPPVPTEAAAGRAKVVSRAAGEYVLEAENGADAYLLLSEAYYPGWTAQIDGKPAEVLPANHLIQAIRLPPGKHVVRFSYRSRVLGWGLGVALLAAMVPVAIALVGRRRR